MKEVAPGIYIETTYPPYNVSLVMTPQGAIVVDLPPDQAEASKWLDEARAVAGKVRYVVLTSASLERQLTAGFVNLPVITTRAMQQALAKYQDERARRDLIAALLAHFPDQADIIAAFNPPKPAIAFEQSITLHDHESELVFETVNGAAPGSLWIHLPAAKLLIAGDTVCVDDVPPIYETADSKAWLDELATLSRRHSVQTILPGRGRGAIDRGALERQREFLRVMRQTARSLAHGGDGNSLSRAAQDLGQVFYNERGLHAVRSIRRSLEHLVKEAGAAQTNEEPDEAE